MTYSILARDPDSGHMGVATQSQAFAVGSSVPWAGPGAGVIASQSMGEPMYGELGLDALKAGLTAAEALRALRSVDPEPEQRQVGMIDSYGGFDAYTGEACVAEAGHSTGECCIALANMMASTSVWNAMVEVFESATGWLPARLLEALHAAEEEGGDIRGVRSAAILVVRADRSGRPWRDQVVDLRVDDAEEPLRQLDRMVAQSDRYHRMVGAFELMLEGEVERAMDELPGFEPDPVSDPDLLMWQAIIRARGGQIDEAREEMASLVAAAPAFIETARRFPDAGLVDRDLIERILPDGRGGPDGM